MNTYKFNPKDCLHKNVRKEIIFGGRTGDYICHDCGEVWSKKEYFQTSKSTKK